MLVLTKTDLLPHVTFDLERVKAAARAVNPGVEIFEVSAVTGSGLPAFLGRIEDLCDRKIG
jgi:hydrogenase nickel incorporation protein HypB